MLEYHKVLKRLIHNTDSKLGALLKDVNLDFVVLVWFRTLFSTVLPVSHVARSGALPDLQANPQQRKAFRVVE